jgi:hypothetical protein
MLLGAFLSAALLFVDRKLEAFLGEHDEQGCGWRCRLR